MEEKGFSLRRGPANGESQGDHLQLLLDESHDFFLGSFALAQELRRAVSVGAHAFPRPNVGLQRRQTQGLVEHRGGELGGAGGLKLGVEFALVFLHHGTYLCGISSQEGVFRSLHQPCVGRPEKLVHPFLDRQLVAFTRRRRVRAAEFRENDRVSFSASMSTIT
eukprot:CAMPEP_0171662482 /NCGR_PEP_ID=MMETSP0990-20121206/45573_1 /TAXON_ID=483369 /ORGANISM="non described non described, Strain CCMP2098" /LENGTH=163 /DNA_ID=CAMNT_0012244895 /DNA_START=457 /DNA_END=951 /DNA_ORIENTATION=-